MNEQDPSPTDRERRVSLGKVQIVVGYRCPILDANRDRRWRNVYDSVTEDVGKRISTMKGTGWSIGKRAIDQQIQHSIGRLSKRFNRKRIAIEVAIVRQHAIDLING